MKRIWILPFLAICALGQVRSSVTLTWDYPPEEVTNVTFNIYSASTVTGEYSVTTNVSGTNVTLPISAGNHFYYATATNEFGESDPSNTVNATIARKVQGLKIQ